MDDVHSSYRELSERDKATIQLVKSHGQAFINALGSVSIIDGRCAALAKTKIEEAVMWAVKGITA